MVDSDGWLRTGDLCYFDNEGFLFIVDRLKELIKYKGYQVPPAELEHILHTHPDITEAYVIPYAFSPQRLFLLHRCKKYEAKIEEVKSGNYMRFVFSIRMGFTWNKKEVVMEKMVGQRWMVGMVVMVDCVEVAGGEM
uniref:AMP-dependent synthetase/ligase domain-containing protein n=1 Tax=Lactuca sativa TaxID=4236 RepID=A0A9R1XCF1_LACSA|nr:hypothetical protein LSAT_V11C500257060 [Lactuca sativa]